RQKGVALVTVIHLKDDEDGESALNRGFVGALTNPSGWFDHHVLDPLNERSGHRKHHGLTDLGKETIVRLAKAGILSDLTHMHPDAVDDALAVCEKNRIPPVVTHGMFKPVQDDERAYTREQVLRIYKLGGTFSTPLNGAAVDPCHPEVPVPQGLEK